MMKVRSEGSCRVSVMTVTTSACGLCLSKALPMLPLGQTCSHCDRDCRVPNCAACRTVNNTKHPRAGRRYW